MAESEAFECVCAGLEGATDFDRLEARGTIRIVLKQAGLEPQKVGPHQLAVVVERLLPSEIEVRGVRDAEGLCTRLAAELRTMRQVADPNSPDAVFARLAGGAAHD